MRIIPLTAPIIKIKIINTTLITRDIGIFKEAFICCSEIEQNNGNLLKNYSNIQIK